MSYWGMTVVTRMMGALPVVGGLVVGVLWGGSVASVLRLVRFYSLHYLLSLVIGVAVAVHLAVLHDKGRSNPLGVFRRCDKISFHPLYSLKDFLGFMLVFRGYWVGLFVLRYFLMDETNFEEVNYLSTPTHIKPEWYFLFAYCILRSVRRKLGGVVLMFRAIGVLLFLRVSGVSSRASMIWGGLYKLVVEVLAIRFIMLIILGGLEVAYPFVALSKGRTAGFFVRVFIISLMRGVDTK